MPYTIISDNVVLLRMSGEGEPSPNVTRELLRAIYPEEDFDSLTCEALGLDTLIRLGDLCGLYYAVYQEVEHVCFSQAHAFAGSDPEDVRTSIRECLMRKSWSQPSVRRFGAYLANWLRSNRCDGRHDPAEFESQLQDKMTLVVNKVMQYFDIDVAKDIVFEGEVRSKRGECEPDWKSEATEIVQSIRQSVRFGQGAEVQDVIADVLDDADQLERLIAKHSMEK